ncbi:cytochrome P450 [Irpex rosettiformis]|uniref:Cytochrome P450 n=1 Tax=Irpex rosettiformis TaxID=378272 RepID=A0ACB8U373_9APHY|nr:cytochrome P450 [Irpex rosettiformis]
MSVFLLFLTSLLVSVLLYVIWTFLVLMFRQARSPLRFLPGPPSPSFFMGNLREMHDAENTNLVGQWQKAYGSTFVYRGFIGGCRLMTTDPVAVTHILSRGYDYPKPDFVRDALASMAAGHDGLITVEGDQHRKQRKILNPAFSSSHIKSISPIFWDKALKLRDLWLSIVDFKSSSASTPMDPFSPVVSLANGAVATGISRWIPNPFSSFTGSKAVRSNGLSTLREEKTSNSRGVKVDVLAWLARATLDVIGEAGFGYVFNSLNAAVEQNELARAFGVIFSTARKFRVITILQVWFPVLRKFRRNSATEDAATATMHRIGSELIEERLRNIMASSPQDDSSQTDGRDLLSVLLRSSLAAIPTQQLSTKEILCQISTFLAAGHETSSSALTWTLYALSRSPRIQHKLRQQLQNLPISPSHTSESTPSPEDIDLILSEPYLDACIRESLRLYAPVTSTMRVAAHDDFVPVSRPYKDTHGRTCDFIQLNKDDIITIPIQAMNKSLWVWGDDAHEYVPERFMKSDEGEEEEFERGLKGLWGGVLTFGSGHVVNGNRSCIGYRFAINERWSINLNRIKIFLYILLMDLEFSIDPLLEVEKKVNVVTRPFIKSEPHMGNQMPLLIRRVQADPPT